VPGHQGIRGNEEDCLVKETSKRGTSERVIGLPFAIGKATIRKLMDKEHLSRWNKCSGCRRSKLLMEGLTDSRATELAAMSKQRFGTTMGLLTGHVALKAHFLKLKIAEDDICRLCGQNGEDSVHVLCPVLACKRLT